eukprot:7489393-Pyramimonas_sp.AAC.1
MFYLTAGLRGGMYMPPWQRRGGMYCAKCSGITAKQNSWKDSAKWNQNVGTVRCTNGKCLSLYDEKADMSEAQKKHAAAGERLCRKCAEEREKE